MSIYKGTQLISGVVSPTEPTRNLGQKIESDFQLVDAGLHKPDGSLINGSGIYAPFVQAMALLSVSSPESFCTEQEWQASVTAYGICDKYVYDSTNNTVRLPKHSSAHGNLIESYSSGTNWCRVYSDGWCEQGGILTITGTRAFTNTISLLKSFINTNYTCIANLRANIADGNFITGYNIANMTTSSFVVTGNTYEVADINTGIIWQACGYIDISTYQQKPLYEYIVIATKIKSETEVDFDNLATELQNKVDKASLIEIPAIIETYHNSTSWYRVYSDGWCEQGGVMTIADNTQITFAKPFVDVNYQGQITERVGTAFGQGQQNCRFYPTSTTYATCCSGITGGVLCQWVARGYIR